MKKAVLHCMLSMLCAFPALAAPPAPWRVGTMVFISDDPNDPGTHLLQFPGAPEGFNCTDTFHPDWCLWMTCSTATPSPSTYSCETVPIGNNSCIAVQIEGGVAIKIVNVDSGACKG